MATVAIGGCDPGPGPSEPAASGAAPTASSPRSTPLIAVPSPLAALPVATVRLGELELRVAVAETPASRSRGLMDVEDLGALDGMVFVFPATTQNGFHMKNVPAPLDIAFIGADGRVIEVQTMATCSAEPCPIYHASSPFLWAVEAPAGDLAGVTPGGRFELSERTDPPEAAPS